MNRLEENQTIINAVAIVGIVFTQLMNLSSLPSIIEIFRAKDTLGYPSFPFSVSIIASGLSIIYSILSNQFIVGISSIMTVFQSLIYESFHIHYNHSETLKELFGLIILSAISLLIAPIIKCSIDPDCSGFTTQWIGLIMAIISCLRYGSQAVTFYGVYKAKNAFSISPPMTVGAFMGSLAWSIYSILAGDPYYLSSGIAGLFSCAVQFYFLLIYPRNQPELNKVEKVIEKVETETSTSDLQLDIVIHPLHETSLTQNSQRMESRLSKRRSMPRRLSHFG